MRINGYIQRQVAPYSSSFDENGEPIAHPIEWSHPIGCYINETSRNNNAAYDDGKHKSASMEILIESQYYCPAERIKVTREGVQLGEYAVISERKINLDRVVILV